MNTSLRSRFRLALLDLRDAIYPTPRRTGRHRTPYSNYPHPLVPIDDDRTRKITARVTPADDRAPANPQPLHGWQPPTDPPSKPPSKPPTTRAVAPAPDGAAVPAAPFDNYGRLLPAPDGEFRDGRAPVHHRNERPEPEDGAR